jgi:ubiquinone/menaquinone biosynthesis C-methylase UbiE
MNERKFDPKKLHKLNDPRRLADIPPNYIWNKINITRPNILVDIGAGTGFFSIHFLKYTQNGKIIACDTSDIMIKWMKDNVCLRYPNIVPLKIEENTIPLKEGIADLVYMINLHHELNNPKAMLEESFRILNSDGILLIVDWKKEDMPEGPPLHIRYLAEQVKDQLISTGFKNIAIFKEMPKHFLVVARKR